MLRLSVVLALCVLASNAAFTSDEYYKRQATVFEMDLRYRRYLDTDAYDANKRQTTQMGLLRFCDTKLNNSHAWIMKALKDPKGSLIEAQLSLNKFNFEKTEMFIKTAFETAKMASRIGLWCSATKGNEQVARRIIEFEKTIEAEIPEITIKLKAKMESSLRSNVTALVERWVAENSFVFDKKTEIFMQEAAETLQKSYPVGQWITVGFPKWEYHKVCYRPGTFLISKSGKWFWIFKVFLLRNGQKYDIKAANDALNRIKDKQVKKFCRDEMEPVLQEGNYTCNSNQFTFFGVFGNAYFGASDARLFRTRDIKRQGPYDTKCRFRVAILV